MSQSIQYLKFSDIAKSEKGKKPKNCFTENKPGLIPYIDIQAFENKIFTSYTDGKDCLLCDDGDILLVWDGSRSGLVGRAYRGAVGSTLVKINVPCIEKNFLYHYLAWKYLVINTRSKGTGTPHVDPDLFWNSSFPVFSIMEQKQIVAQLEELLSDLDNAIENLKKEQGQLEVYRLAILKDAFEGKLTNKNIRKGVLPDGWKNVPLGEVCVNVEYGSAAKSKKMGKIPVLRMGNIQDGKLDWKDLVYTDNDAEISKYLLKKNDVLFNRTNSPEWVGKTALYNGEMPAIFAGYLIRINRIESLIDASYLTYYLNSPIAKRYGNSVKSFGVNQSNINGTKLKKYPLPLAPYSEQRVIVQEIEYRNSICIKIEESIKDNLLKAEALRQSIFKQAFEGKLTKQWRKDHKELISGDKSVEALLKKIKDGKETLKVRSKGRKIK